MILVNFKYYKRLFYTFNVVTISSTMDSSSMVEGIWNSRHR
jgi:hypothetical protein